MIIQTRGFSSPPAVRSSACSDCISVFANRIQVRPVLSTTSRPLRSSFIRTAIQMPYLIAVDCCLPLSIRYNLRIGRAWQMKYASRKAGGLPLGDRDLILIDFPPLYRDLFWHIRAYTTVAVGHTGESMANWTVALGMGGVQSDAPASTTRTD